MSARHTFFRPGDRSSSDTLTSALTLSALGRRRSTSSFQASPSHDQTSSTSSPVQTFPLVPKSSPPSSMFPAIFSRCLDLLYLQREWPTPASPRSSADEPVLPLSASATETTFGPEIHATLLSKSRPHLWWRHMLQSINKPILFLPLLFVASTVVVLLALSTLPITFSWPRTIADLAQLGSELHGYSQSGSGPLLHVMSVMTVSAIWKHAWSIPGSVVWNVLAGALFPTAFATLFLTVLTTIGSVCATLLATPLEPFLKYLFPKALDMTRVALEGIAGDIAKEPGTETESSAWVKLSVLRLVGVVPWSGINIACGVCGVAISDCFLGSFIGCLPWTAVTCQIGNILQTVVSKPSLRSETISSLLTSPEILLKLVFLSFLSLAPILGRNRLRGFASNSIINGNSEHLSARESIRTWRQKLRARLAHRSAWQEDIQSLAEEKLALQELPS